jgi:3',5'-cyclic AMP phosphodiesterase CpdA
VAPILTAVSDLHVGYAANRAFVERLRPASAEDWLIVAGDIGERTTDIVDTLRLLRSRYAKVIWAPGNHELWTSPRDSDERTGELRGQERYAALVAHCREIDVVTPEDEYPVWTGPGGPAIVAPLFLLYDYSFHPPGCATKEEGLAYAHQTGVVCTDEFLLHPDPYPSREDWCAARVAETERRLAACDPATPLVLVNHYSLVREPMDVLRFPEFAQWCGTVRTADWHTRFTTLAMVYGHLHIPRTTYYDGVRFEEVSLGYPREWQPRTRQPGAHLPRQILPVPESGPLE